MTSEACGMCGWPIAAHALLPKHRTCMTCGTDHIPYGIAWRWWVDGKPYDPECTRSNDQVSNDRVLGELIFPEEIR